MPIIFRVKLKNSMQWMHKGSLDLLNAQISMRGDLDYARTNGHSRLLLNVKN